MVPDAVRGFAARGLGWLGEGRKRGGPGWGLRVAREGERERARGRGGWEGVGWDGMDGEWFDRARTKSGEEMSRRMYMVHLAWGCDCEAAGFWLCGWVHWYVPSHSSVCFGREGIA